MCSRVHVFISLDVSVSTRQPSASLFATRSLLKKHTMQLYTLAITLAMTNARAFDWAHQNNVLGTPLQVASVDPMTGFTRDGKCTAYTFDSGSHTVAAVITQQFLDYTKSKGNDLSTPRGSFPGLVPGDRWCLCVSRWIQAIDAGAAPPVVLEATNESVLNHVELDFLKKYSHEEL